MNLTNMLLLGAAALGAGYYVVEYKPAQERKKKKRRPLPDVTTPAGMLYVDTLPGMIEVTREVIAQEKPYFTLGVLKRGQTYARLKPIITELMATYADRLVFIEVDFGKMLEELAASQDEVLIIKSDVIMSNSGFATSFEQAEGICTLLTVSGSPVALLESNDETMDSPYECLELDFADPTAVVNRYVQMAEEALELAATMPRPLPEPQPEPGQIAVAARRPVYLGWYL